MKLYCPAIPVATRIGMYHRVLEKKSIAFAFHVTDFASHLNSGAHKSASHFVGHFNQHVHYPLHKVFPCRYKVKESQPERNHLQQKPAREDCDNSGITLTG